MANAVVEFIDKVQHHLNYVGWGFTKSTRNGAFKDVSKHRYDVYGILIIPSDVDNVVIRDPQLGHVLVEFVTSFWNFQRGKIDEYPVTEDLVPIDVAHNPNLALKTAS